MDENDLFCIQCDWDDTLNLSQRKAWVSLRKKGDAVSLQGKLQCLGRDSTGNPILTGSNGFTAEYIAKDIIRVKHENSKATMAFLAPCKIYPEIHKKSITCLDVTTTGLCVAFSTENNLLVWDFNRGEMKVKLEGHIGDVYKCKFFPSQRVVLTSGADMRLKIWCAESGINPVTLIGHKRSVTDFVIIDVGKNIISVSKDGSAKLWDCGQSACLDTLICVSSDINSCAICEVPSTFPLGDPDDSPSDREVGTDNKILLLGCEDGTLHCIAVHSRRKLFTGALPAPVNTVEFLHTGETQSEVRFAAGCQDGKVYVFDYHDPKKHLNSWHCCDSPVLHIISFKNYGFLVSHGNGAVYFIPNSLNRVLLSLTGPDCDPVYCLSTDGRFLYTSCRDAVIRRYNLEKALNTLLE